MDFSTTDLQLQVDKNLQSGLQCHFQIVLGEVWAVRAGLYWFWVRKFVLQSSALRPTFSKTQISHPAPLASKAPETPPKWEAVSTPTTPQPPPHKTRGAQPFSQQQHRNHKQGTRKHINAPSQARAFMVFHKPFMIFHDQKPCLRNQTLKIVAHTSNKYSVWSDQKSKLAYPTSIWVLDTVRRARFGQRKSRVRRKGRQS